MMPSTTESKFKLHKQSFRWPNKYDINEKAPFLWGLFITTKPVTPNLQHVHRYIIFSGYIALHENIQSRPIWTFKFFLQANLLGITQVQMSGKLYHIEIHVHYQKKDRNWFCADFRPARQASSPHAAGQIGSEHSGHNSLLREVRVRHNLKTVMARATENLIFFKPCPECEISCIAPLTIPYVIISQRHYVHCFSSLVQRCQTWQQLPAKLFLSVNRTHHLSHTKVTDMWWSGNNSINKKLKIYLNIVAVVLKWAYSAIWGNDRHKG